MDINASFILGKRFGKLIPLSLGEPFIYGGFKRKAFVCQCDCGAIKTIAWSSIKSGLSASCGCERVKKTSQKNYKHGHSVREKETSTYVSWKNMHLRCSNPKSTAYKNYGGRGIKVCERWKSFENFLIDMGEKPDSSLSIERIDNELGYTPSNCKWATALEQRHNRRDCKK